MPYPVAAARGGRQTGAAAATPLALYSSLTHYWKLDEASGTRADSISDATLADQNTVGNNTGVVYPLAGQFVAASLEYLNIANRTSLQTGDVDFAFAAWAYLDSEPSEAWVLSKFETTGNKREYSIFYFASTDRWRFNVSPNGALPITSTEAARLGAVSTGSWYFLVGLHDAVHDRLVIVANGLCNELAHATGVYSSDSPFAVGAVGRAAAGNYFNGRIGPVMYWKNFIPSPDDFHWLYNAGAGRTLDDMAAVQTIPRRGIWSWFTNPRALYHNGKTYFCPIDETGNVKIYSYDHSTGTVATQVLRYGLEVDDHAHASIMVRASDSKLLAFYALHTSTTIYQRISASAEDVSAWGAETSLDASLGGGRYTYPCPIQLTGEVDDPIYLFYREATDVGVFEGLFFSKSTDGGATWAAQTQLFTNGTERPYFQIARNGDTRIDFVATDGHPNSAATNSIYHWYYSGGNYYQSDGTLIGDAGALPLEPADVTKVYDGTTNRAWVWDLAIDGSGYPVIAYTNFVGGTADHRYRYARWNGSAWVDNEIVAAGTYLYAGEPYYSGGISIDKNDPDVVYLSKQVSSQWEIYKYTTADNGATWDAGTAITSGSSAKNCRPFCPMNAHANMAVLWWYGTYTSYASWDTVIKSYPVAVP